MSKRIIALFFVLIILLVSFVSCSNEDSKKSGQPRLGITIYSYNDNF